MGISFDYRLNSDLTVVLNKGDVKYVQLDGRLISVILGTKILDAGATGQVSVSIDSPNTVIASGYADSDIVWTDYSTPTSGTIVTISGVLYKTLNPAPSIIKLYNNSPGTQKIRVSLKGIFN